MNICQRSSCVNTTEFLRITESQRFKDVILKILIVLERKTDRWGNVEATSAKFTKSESKYTSKVREL